MAAHTYRTWLWNQVGFATWNAQWYGGHHMAGYSLLYPPLAALVGTRLVGVVAARRRRRAVRRARPAAGAHARQRRARVVAVPRRRDEQRRDRPDAVHARDRARRRRLGVRARGSRIAAAVLALASIWASPVAGVFLCVAARRDRSPARACATSPSGADWRTAVALVGPAIVGGLRDGRCCSPRAARTTSSAPRSGRCCSSALGALAARRPRAPHGAAGPARALPRVLVGAFAIPNAARAERAAAGRRARAGAAGALRARRARRAPRSLSSRVALLYLQWLPAVRAVDEARGDPSTAGGVPRRGARFLRRAARGRASGVEVPLTRNHWEAAYLAEDYPARARLAPPARPQGQPALLRRQPLTPDATCAWLRDERRPLGRAARTRRWTSPPRAERELLLERRCRSSSSLHASRGLADLGGRATPSRPVSGAARADRRRRRTASTSSAPARPGDRAPARHAVLDDHGRRRLLAADARTGWTRVDVRRAGLLRVRARVLARGALRRGPLRERRGTPGVRCGRVRSTPL